jgi:hypothetical protein
MKKPAIVNALFKSCTGNSADDARIYNKYAYEIQMDSVQELATIHLQLLLHIALGNDSCGPEVAMMECHKIQYVT